MIYVEFQCNRCHIRHKQYVPHAKDAAASYIPQDWIIEDDHVPICPDCQRPRIIDDDGNKL